MMFAAYLLGGAALLWFGLFLLLGPVKAVDLGLSTTGALVLDGSLCLLFFLQHSIMVRRWFQRRLSSVVRDHLQGAVYTISSGIVLMVLMSFWQRTDPILASADGPLRWLLRGLFVASIIGMYWGASALDSFDGFGIRAIKLMLSSRKPGETRLAIRGPYRWIRHPLYAFVLVMLWTYPDLTADRLLLNISFTVWTVIGSVLEERDLIAEFGEPYRDYRREVPMLVPLKQPRRGGER